MPLAMLLCLAQVLVMLQMPDELTNSSQFNLHLAQVGQVQPARVLLLAVGLVGFCALLVGSQMFSDPDTRGLFANVVLLAITGMNGTMLVSDLFSLYVFMEVISVSSFILIAFKRDKLALEGAFKYLVLSAVATVLMLGALSLLMLFAGSTGFTQVKEVLAKSGGTHVLAKLAMAAYVCGLFIKGGLVPFHGWLPGAYSAASAPVSVLLAGIATKVSGLYALVRLTTDVFPANQALGQGLLVVGAISMVVGALVALVQKDMKRLLAYSSISQMGYVVLALGCYLVDQSADVAVGSKVSLQLLGQLALAGAVFHLFNHSVFKSLLFVNSAAVEAQTGTTIMDRLGGLGSRMPYTNATSIIGVLSLAGVPPLAGFWSKLVIIIALWKSGELAGIEAFKGYALLAVAVSVVTLAYLLVMQRRVFFGKPAQEWDSLKEAPSGLVLPAVILAALTVVIGLLFPLLAQWATFLLPAPLNL